MGAAPRLLVVAGHDSSGRAGIDADREAAQHFGVALDAVVSAETRQEGSRVLAIEARDPVRWSAELRAAQAAATVWKSGLLPTAEAVSALAALVDELAGERWVVCDPVLAATGGESFLDATGVERWRTRLLAAGPRGVLVTPNLDEAARLCGLERVALDESSGRLEAAERLLAAGARAVVLKAGHGREQPARDLCLEPGSEPRWLEHARVPGGQLRGSGCRFASALAAGLALGLALPEAVREAGEWVAERIRLAEVCARRASR